MENKSRLVEKLLVMTLLMSVTFQSCKNKNSVNNWFFENSQKAIPIGENVYVFDVGGDAHPDILFRHSERGYHNFINDSKEIVYNDTLLIVKSIDEDDTLKFVYHKITPINDSINYDNIKDRLEKISEKDFIKYNQECQQCSKKIFKK